MCGLPKRYPWFNEFSGYAFDARLLSPCSPTGTLQSSGQPCQEQG